ncbi:MAG: glycine--tRNA ligase subunit beta [Acidobacteria bacterium]|nr:glycine--tRNA ligase subunit beta [Acidobacteriota bacterium]MYK79549.1 glycine--tRNA ligase subunit beta [Acidobacteriota bacterium]
MSGRELLIEIGCEEIPADWVAGLAQGFETAVTEGLDRERLTAETIGSHSTARRLVVHGAGIPESQPDQVQEVLGPPWRVARDEGGGWSRAAAGFARRQGIEEPDFESRLQAVETPRGQYLGIRQVVPGRPAIRILPGILEDALRAVPLPKAMNWDASIGEKPFAFARPIRWIVALFGDEVIPFRIEVTGGTPVAAGNHSYGHRARTTVEEERPGAPFPVDSLGKLVEGLRSRYVLLDDEERKGHLLAAIRRCETAAGESAEVGTAADVHKDLVEVPGAVLGRFPDEFLSLPKEIRDTVLVHHQKFFPFPTSPSFIAVTNLPDDPEGHVRRGAERVVVARLRDARFFWDEDRKVSLAETRPRLAGVVFHQRLGTFREKADRMEELAAWIADAAGADAAAASQAAGLSKCDLTGNLVGEFASLQGLVGGLLLREEGLPETVWRAVYDHYRPGGLDGDLPRGPEGAAVSLADRADTLAGLFLAGEEPSGSGDPFALRRAALSLIRVLRDAPAEYPGPRSGWPSPEALLCRALDGYRPDDETRPVVCRKLADFVNDRLPHAFVGPSTPKGVVNAVLATRDWSHPVADTWQRIVDLAKAVGSGDYATLAAASRRVRRILAPEVQEEKGAGLDPALLTEPAAEELHAALERVEAEVLRCFAETRYFPAFQALATLSPAIATFFDDVLVMAEDPAVRANRLALLARLDALFSEVGDLSQIEASAS